MNPHPIYGHVTYSRLDPTPAQSPVPAAELGGAR